MTGWEGDNVGVISYGFHCNMSPTMSHGVLECDSM